MLSIVMYRELLESLLDFEKRGDFEWNKFMNCMTLTNIFIRRMTRLW